MRFRMVAAFFAVAGSVGGCSNGESRAPSGHDAALDHGSPNARDGNAGESEAGVGPNADAEAGATRAGDCGADNGETGGGVTVACNLGTPGRLAIDAKNLYWTVERPGPVLMKAPLTGGAAEALASDANGALGIAIDSANVYFTEPSAGRVMRASISGGSGAVPLATGLDAPTYLASDGVSLYWTGGSTVGSITKLGLQDGGAPVTLVDGLPRPRAIAVDTSYVYWTDFTEGAVMRTPKDVNEAGVATARIAFGLQQPSDLAILGGYAYFPDHAGRVLRVAVMGGILEVLATVSGTPFGIAVDGSFLYFSTLGMGGIFKVPIAGGQPVQTVALAPSDPHFLVLDANSVYWGNWGGGGSVEKAAK